MSQPMQTLKEWEPLFVGATLVVVLLLFFKVTPSLKVDSMFDRNMPTGSNNLAFVGLRTDTGSTNDIAKDRGFEGMVSIDQGPSFWGPTAYQQVADDQARGIATDLGTDNGSAWTEGMSSRLSKIQVAEGMGNKASVVLNPY